MTKKIISSILGLMVLLLNASIFAAEPNKQAIVFGYVGNGAPVSNSDNGVAGYCHAVSKRLKREYEVIELPLKMDQRFDHFAKLDLTTLDQPSLDKFERLGLQNPNNEVIRVECGPDSKTVEREAILKNLNGVFSDTFAETSIKLLIRNEALDKAAHKPSDLRIGVISHVQNINKPVPDVYNMKGSANTHDPVNTATAIQSVFPNSPIISVVDRADAIQKLKENIIDAYASDEILLFHVWQDNLIADQEYSLYPVIGGYSHEAYAISIFNDRPNADQRTVLSTINAWLKTSEANTAKMTIQPPRDWLKSGLQWLNREDNLNRARWAIYLGLVLLALTPGLIAIPLYLPRLRKQVNNPSISAGSDLNKKDFTLTTVLIDVLRGKLQGLTAREIADQLKRSPRTVEGQIRSINDRFELHFGTKNIAVQKTWLEEYDKNNLSKPATPSPQNISQPAGSVP